MGKRKPKTDPEREERIRDEIVVDAHDEVERAMSWFYYLQQQLRFPFKARCIAKRSISPLKPKDEVEVIGMANEPDSLQEIWVKIRWQKYEWGVPLAQLQPIGVDEETQQAVEDWHYWTAMGYEY